LSTFETVFVETPARKATSEMVTFCGTISTILVSDFIGTLCWEGLYNALKAMSVSDRRFLVRWQGDKGRAEPFAAPSALGMRGE
jgi:hypothetical protein